jgi:hypothetical protein
LKKVLPVPDRQPLNKEKVRCALPFTPDFFSNGRGILSPTTKLKFFNAVFCLNREGVSD